MAAEAAKVHADWYERYHDLYHPRTRELIERGAGVSGTEAAAARDGRETLRRELVEGLRAGGVDLWVSPAATGPAPEGLESTGDPVMNLPWTHAGLPAVSLPLPRAPSELPLGLQVVGRHGGDEGLLAWVAVLERELAE